MIAIFLSVENLVSVLLFGTSTSQYSYPIFSAIRYISIPPFFEHMEIGVVIVWVIGVYVKLSVFYYVLCLGLAQLMRLSNYRQIVFPTGLVICAMSFWVFTNTAELNKAFDEIDPFYFPAVLTILPMLLLIISIAKKKKDKGKQKDVKV